MAYCLKIALSQFSVVTDLSLTKSVELQKEEFVQEIIFYRSFLVHYFVSVWGVLQVRTFMIMQMGGPSSAVNDDMIDRLTSDFMKLQDVNKDGRIQRGEFAKPTHKTKDEL